MKDGRFIVVKAIPLGNDRFIRENTNVDKVHGCYYLDGLLVEKEFQQDFENLLNYEARHGWNYLRPNRQVVGNSIVEGNTV